MTEPLFAIWLFVGSASEESWLSKWTKWNATLIGRYGMVVEKKVAELETFAVWNIEIEDCECVNGSFSGMQVDNYHFKTYHGKDFKSDEKWNNNFQQMKKWKIQQRDNVTNGW